MEEKLTEGYARALTLEAERWRLERRLGQAARDLEGPGVSSRAEEVGSLGKRLESADGELTRLRPLLDALHRRTRTPYASR